jgi:hypothetical protein
MLTPRELQLVRRVHHTVGHLPPTKKAPVSAGEVVSLLNVIHALDRQLDQAAVSLETQLTTQAEIRLDDLLGGPRLN